MSWERNAYYLVGLAATLLLVAFLRPDFLSDSNEFLDGFVDQDLLGFLGVILTISLGFLAQLHVQVGKLLEKIDEEGVKEIRDEIRHTAKVLIFIFFLSILLAIVDPLIPSNQTYEIIINSFAIFMIVFFFLILSDIVLAILDFDI